MTNEQCLHVSYVKKCFFNSCAAIGTKFHKYFWYAYKVEQNVKKIFFFVLIEF